MPSPYRLRIWLDWVYSRHARPPQSPQTCAGLTLPTEGLLLQHQPHWSCQRVRLSNGSIDQTPFGTLTCRSGNKASLCLRLRIKPILLAGMRLANAAQAGVKRNTSETSWVSISDNRVYRDLSQRVRAYAKNRAVSRNKLSLGKLPYPTRSHCALLSRSIRH